MAQVSVLVRMHSLFELYKYILEVEFYYLIYLTFSILNLILYIYICFI